MLKNARQADTGVKLEVNERYQWRRVIYGYSSELYISSVTTSVIRSEVLKIEAKMADIDVQSL